MSPYPHIDCGVKAALCVPNARVRDTCGERHCQWIFKECPLLKSLTHDGVVHRQSEIKVCGCAEVCMIVCMCEYACVRV